MPYHVHQTEPLPPEVAAAYQLVKLPLRLALVRWLTLNPDSLVSEIVGGIGGERNAIRSNLRDLEAIGVIVETAQEWPRERRRARYRVNELRTNALVQHLLGFLAPE